MHKRGLCCRLLHDYLSVCHVQGTATFPSQKGRSPGAPLFWGSPLAMTTLQNAHVSQGNTWGRGVYLEVSHASHPKRAEFQHSPSGSHGFMFSPFNVERPNSGEGSVLRGQHAISFAQVRRAICQRRLSFLWEKRLASFSVILLRNKQAKVKK